MCNRLAAGWVACFLISSFVGCAQYPGLIRGQDPYVEDNSFQAKDPHTWVHSNNGHPFPYNNRVADLMEHSVNRGNYPGYCPDCYKNGEMPHWDGKGWSYNDGTAYYGWAPTHTYQHQYKIPRNLSYPDANTPAGVVVYPYYTHKGPDCFFAK